MERNWWIFAALIATVLPANVEHQRPLPTALTVKGRIVAVGPSRPDLVGGLLCFFRKVVHGGLLESAASGTPFSYSRFNTGQNRVLANPRIENGAKGNHRGGVQKWTSKPPLGALEPPTELNR